MTSPAATQANKTVHYFKKNANVNQSFTILNKICLLNFKKHCLFFNSYIKQLIESLIFTGIVLKTSCN